MYTAAGSHRIALGEQLVVNHAAGIPPTAEKNFATVELRLGLRWRLLFSWQPVRDAFLVLVENPTPVSYTHLRAHETSLHLVCRLLLEKKNKKF